MKMSPSELKGILEQKNKAWEQQTLMIFIDRVRKAVSLVDRAKQLIALRKAIKEGPTSSLKVYGPFKLWYDSLSDFTVGKRYEIGFANVGGWSTESPTLDCDEDLDDTDRAFLSIFEDGRLMVSWRQEQSIIFPYGASPERIIVEAEAEKNFIPIWRYESVRSCLYTFNTRFDKFEKKFLKYVNKLIKL